VSNALRAQGGLEVVWAPRIENVIDRISLKEGVVFDNPPGLMEVALVKIDSEEWSRSAREAQKGGAHAAKRDERHRISRGKPCPEKQ